MTINVVLITSIFLLLLGARTTAQAQSLPDLVCIGGDIVYVGHSGLKTSTFPSTDTFRFMKGKLYLSSKERAEYLYDDVRATEPGRYVSAHMTIHFHDGQFQEATAVHTNAVQTKVVTLRCIRARS